MQTNPRIRAKAGALVVAAAYRLAATQDSLINEVSEGKLEGYLAAQLRRCVTRAQPMRLPCLLQGLTVRCLALCEALLGGEAACAISAKKLVLVLHSMFHSVPRSPRKHGEDPWVSSARPRRSCMRGAARLAT